VNVYTLKSFDAILTAAGFTLEHWTCWPSYLSIHFDHVKLTGGRSLGELLDRLGADIDRATARTGSPATGTGSPTAPRERAGRRTAWFLTREGPQENHPDRDARAWCIHGSCGDAKEALECHQVVFQEVKGEPSCEGRERRERSLRVQQESLCCMLALV